MLPSPKVHEWLPIVPPESVDVSVNVAVRPLVVNVKFAVGVPPPPPPPMMACVLSQRLVSFDHVDCIAYEPLPIVMRPVAPWPAV